MEVAVYPLTKDTRTWWGKLCGEIYNPVMAVSDSTAHHVLMEGDRMNRQFSHIWHCKIKRVRFDK